MQSTTDCPTHATCRCVTEAARKRLSNSPYPPVRGVSCECDGGLLRLRGRVPSFYHKQLVQEAVADLRGVLQVLNQTEVDPQLS